MSTAFDYITGATDLTNDEYRQVFGHPHPNDTRKEVSREMPASELSNEAIESELRRLEAYVTVKS